MAIDAYIGQPFVFQTVFLDPVTGAPLTVTGVNVTLFYYTPTPATRITLLNAVAMSAVTPPSPSRYSYQYTLDPALTDGTPLYVEYRGTDALLNVIVQREVLNAKSYPSDLGLRASFTTPLGSGGGGHGWDCGCGC
jgi:hypothetical protein